MQRKIELLAPAKNLECGMEAVNHGADAVYIGAPKFGARAAAGNSLEEIAALVVYAHRYRVRIYVALNTILREEELRETEEMIGELYRMGVDALIVQDMSILQLNLPPIPLHASTQMDNRTKEKVGFLYEAGFSQVVLARELSLGEIAKIHDVVPQAALEVFVHGALCVSYSGQCYASQACSGRSANRGACAQFCRLSFDWIDAQGKIIAQGKHLLSLKDLNRSEELEALLDAGVTSLKIEGRLKGVSYVKNVTAAYRRRLDAILDRRKEYVRASSGRCSFTFEPQLDKSFNRSFTPYLLAGRGDAIFSFDTPKSVGEEMGRVKEVRTRSFTVAGVKEFHNGDGACYFDAQGELRGFQINRAESNVVFPNQMPRLEPRTPLYRSYDHVFNQLLAHTSAERKIDVSILFVEQPEGFALSLTDEEGICITHELRCEKVPSLTPQEEEVRKQLTKLGNTPFRVANVRVEYTHQWFIARSTLSQLRREAIELLLEARQNTYPQEVAVHRATQHPYPQSKLSYLGNVMNSHARAFYTAHGVEQIDPAYELTPPPDAVLMRCKHCLRYSMGWCAKHHGKPSPFEEPFFLIDPVGTRFELSFDCKQCEMTLRKAL